MGSRMKVIRYTSPGVHFIPNNNKRNLYCNQMCFDGDCQSIRDIKTKRPILIYVWFTGGRYTPG